MANINRRSPKVTSRPPQRTKSLDGIVRDSQAVNQQQIAVDAVDELTTSEPSDINSLVDDLAVAEPAATTMPTPENDLTKSIDETIAELNDLDDKEPTQTPSRRHSKQRSTTKRACLTQRKKWSLKKKMLISILIIILLVVAALGIYAYTLLDKVSNIFEGNPTDILTPITLKEDANGRSNILVFGTSEDDEGHSGAALADSIMVISADQDTSDIAMFSIPRDLWVNYGFACSVGYQGKINAGYVCGLMANSNDEQIAAQYFTKVVGEALGMEMPYYVKVDYGAISGLVDALGGIDVDIYTDDPRGIYDVRLNLVLPAGINHLDGKTALDLARARNSKGGYGLSQSNFDREKNQQRIVKAIQKKALSLGVLANPQQATDILTSLGDNVKTNISMSELRRALDVALGLGDKEIRSIDIRDQLTTGNINGASVVMPVGGINAYPALQTFINEQLRGEANIAEGGSDV